LDASLSQFGLLKFIVVPRHLQYSVGSGGPTSFTNQPTFRTSNFRVEVDNVNGSRITEVRGLHMAWAKVPVDNGSPRPEFAPGNVAFDDLQMKMLTNPPTAQQFDSWVSQVVNGDNSTRGGRIDLMNQQLTSALAEIHLFDLFPLSFPPLASVVSFSTLRTITLDVGRFTIQ
jgi:hypothetical protein